MSEDQLKAARQSGKSGVGILDRLMLEVDRLTKEREDLLEKIALLQRKNDKAAQDLCSLWAKYHAMKEERDWQEAGHDEPGRDMDGKGTK